MATKQQSSDADNDAKEPKGFHQNAKDNDIVLGRGRAVMDHPGNVNLRNLVKDHQAIYQLLSDKSEKSKVVMSIISYIRSQGSRFLSFDTAIKKYKEVEDEIAIEKVSRLLRNNEQPSKKRSRKKKNDGDKEGDRQFEKVFRRQQEIFGGMFSSGARSREKSQASITVAREAPAFPDQSSADTSGLTNTTSTLTTAQTNINTSSSTHENSLFRIDHSSPFEEEDTAAVNDNKDDC